MRVTERSIARWPAGGAEGRPGVLRALALVAFTVGAATTGSCGHMKSPDDGPSGSAGTSGDAGAGTDAGAAGADAYPSESIEVDGGACTAVIAQHPDEGAVHVACTPIPTYGTRPPSSGNHYMIWADFKTYTTPVPWGHLVHSLEHGAIVIVYNCSSADAACAAEIARAQAMMDALPFPLSPVDADVLDGFQCVLPTRHRVILAPDPTLDVRWAASAWTWTLRSTCFDETTFGGFIKAHYAQGRENFCIELHEPFCDVQ